ncbi:cytochrome P450 [Thermopolyspora sp. NPDC052614]|uniref:cytochrome P450 n=1 Tax=Thermopolyspora sp. NPDC052614 TaxID=3155682 RepID=UPI00343DD466
MTIASAPVAGVDLFTDPVLAHPHGAYRTIRNAGPAVYLPEHRLWVLSRYREVRHALNHPLIFTPAHGTGLLDLLSIPATGATSGRTAPAGPSATTDASAPSPDLTITALTALTASSTASPAGRATPLTLNDLETVIVNHAERLVDDLVARSSFDAVAELATPFALKTIGDLIGLPAAARPDLMTCAEASLQANAPLDDHTLRALMDLESVFTFLTTELTASCTPASATPASATPDHAATCGHDPTVHLLKTFAMPCVYTIAVGISGMLWLLATHPEAWHALRTTPSLVAAAVEESLRLEPPVQILSRTTTRDVRIGDTLIPAGGRVLLLLAAANRDPRKWPDPDHFEIRRNPTDHLSLGLGAHSHLTATVAKTHLRAVLGALVNRAPALYLDGTPRRRITSTTRAFASLPLYATQP